MTEKGVRDSSLVRKPLGIPRPSEPSRRDPTLNVSSNLKSTWTQLCAKEGLEEDSCRRGE